MTPPLFIPDMETLRRKISDPPAGMATILARFNDRLATDETFRQTNGYLHALLGDADAIALARETILKQAAYLGTMEPEDPKVEIRAIYCWGPGALRMTVYHNWLQRHGVWTPAETLQIGHHLLTFCEEQMASTLRSRTPSSNNQSLSMGLTCAVTGYAFREVPALAASAQALYQYGRHVVEEVLAFTPRDGYGGEGSTYQSQVVSPLMAFTGAFFSQIDGDDILTKRWEPHGSSILDILRVETCLGSPGYLLPPWDHYGWQQQTSLSPIAYWASHTGNTAALAFASSIWDRDNMIAWASDDRMWSLIFWPETPTTAAPSIGLTGWTLPQTAAAIDDLACGSRLMLAWDQCAQSLHGYTRYQVNPNHLMYEVGGVPIFGDGVTSDWNPPAYLGVAAEDIVAQLSDAQRRQMTFTYGSPATWAINAQVGLIGSANTVYLDGEAGYAPLAPRRGQCCYEERTPERHIVTAESVAYYTPRYDLTRARRTISTNPMGISWIVDNYHADSDHHFTWQVYLRRGAICGDNSASLQTPEGAAITIAWHPVARTELETVTVFPRRDDTWPDEGSDRLRLHASGRHACFVVCLIPSAVENARIRQRAERTWVVEWDGGMDTFTLPTGAEAPCELSIDPPLTRCDLNDDAFGLSAAPDATLLAALDTPPPHQLAGDDPGHANADHAGRSGSPATDPCIIARCQADLPCARGCRVVPRACCICPGA